MLTPSKARALVLAASFCQTPENSNAELKWPEGIFPERDNSWLNCSDIWKQRENTMNWWIKLLISLTKHHYNPLKSNLYPRLYTKAWNNLICSWLQCEFHIYFPIDPIYIQSQQTLPSGQFIGTKKNAPFISTRQFKSTNFLKLDCPNEFEAIIWLEEEEAKREKVNGITLL